MTELMVKRDDLRRFEVRDTETPSFGDGEALLRVAPFALTANNVTYAAFGDAMGYWRFFPAADGWGRVPVWGFADVVASQAEGVAQGERVYGYFPMSSHLVVTPGKVSPRSFVDVVAHRAPLPPVYNQYVRVAADPGYDPAREHHQALLRPLFTTSFLLDDWLADNDLFGARQVVLASASSKTALGLAHLLSAADRAEVVGLTSAANREFVAGLGCYDRAVVYGELAAEADDVPTVLVDMAGDGRVVAEVHHHFKEHLLASCQVGATHWEHTASPPDLPGPRPQLFFAPDHVVRRTREWGTLGFDDRVGAAWQGFLTSVDGWLEIVEHDATTVGAAYLDVLEGRARPREGHIVSL